MYVLNMYGVYIFEYIPSHPFNIFWMPQLPTNVNLVGCFVFSLNHPGELALGDDSEALKPVTEKTGSQGEMVGHQGNDLSHSSG